MVDLYFLVFIHIESRQIWVSPCTANPTGEWTTQQARNFDMFLQDENLPCTILQRDRGAEYVQTFDDAFTGEGRTVKLTPAQSPNLQAFVERVIQTRRCETVTSAGDRSSEAQTCLPHRARWAPEVIPRCGLISRRRKRSQHLRSLLRRFSI